jgi:hypothetical protein
MVRGGGDGAPRRSDGRRDQGFALLRRAGGPLRSKRRGASQGHPADGALREEREMSPEGLRFAVVVIPLFALALAWAEWPGLRKEWQSNGRLLIDASRTKSW